MELPAFYYQHAKFVPHMPDHVLTMAFHVIPKGNEVVQNIFQDGTVNDSKFSEIYENNGDDAILTLYKSDGRKGLKMQKEIMIKHLGQCMMKFSRSGKYFAIVNKSEGEQDDELMVYESENMITCLENIEASNPLFSQKLNKADNGETIMIQFDIHDKVISVASKLTLQTFSLDEMGSAFSNYHLNQEKHCRIIDIVIDSSKGNPYECHLVVKVYAITQVQIFEINSPDNTRSISFINKGGNIQVRLSDDTSQAIFTNGMEDYLLKGDIQESFP